MSSNLIGKTITEMKIARDKKAILFISDCGLHYVAKVEGDCCSTSWVESIEMPALGLPFRILQITDLELNKGPVSNDEYEYLQFYGAKVSTDKGDMIIDYRNESNGYYGGDITWPGSYFYPGVFKQNESREEWVDIVDAG